MPPESLPSPSLPEDERVLLLLGLLSTQARHGYEMNDFIEHNLGQVIHLKKATAYQLLERLEQHGLIESHTEQHGLRPTRKVYHITGAGREHFRQMLTAQLRQQEPLILSGNIPVMFAESLSVSDLLVGLRERQEQLAERLESQEQDSLPGPAGVNLALQRIHHLTRADYQWLTQTIEQLELSRKLEVG